MTRTPLSWCCQKEKGFAAAAVGMTLLAIVLSYPGFLGWTKRTALGALIHKEGQCWSAPLPLGFKAPLRRDYIPPDVVDLYENGVALKRQAYSAHHIADGGWGRYGFDRGQVMLSSSDGGSLAGRRYELQIGAVRVPEVGLLALWVCAMSLWLLALRYGWKPPFRRSPWPMVVCGGVIMWAAGCVLAPVIWADKFFETLWLPVLWAAGLAALSKGIRSTPLTGLLAYSFLPAVAAYTHFAVGGASHSSFLVAGAIPYSDAWGHFYQAAQIGMFGATDHAFVGRYLYPMFLSLVLWLAGWNLQLALALVLGFSLAGLALLCRVIYPAAGFIGTWALALCGVLFLRAHVAGVAMTEGLGFLGGVLGSAMIFLAAEKRSVGWFISGLASLAIGMAARPGAVLVLPALGLCAALMFRQGRFVRMVLILGAALAVTLAPFALNAGLGYIITTKSTIAFNNFAFSLHGMLLGQGWEKSAELTGYDATVAMVRSRELLVQQPWLIAQGYGRALQYVVRKGFFFRFNEERRLAAIMTLLAGIGLVAVWFLPAWRPHALWLSATAAGIILSLPFAPPWDASERPYAATVPMQCLLAAAGAAGVVSGMRSLGRLPAESRSAALPTSVARGIMAASLLVAGVLLLATWRALALSHEIMKEKVWPPVFHAGSMTRVVDLADYQERLSELLSKQGQAPRGYLEVGEGAILGVDWSRFGVIAVREPLPIQQQDLIENDWLAIDPAIRRQTSPVPAKTP